MSFNKVRLIFKGNKLTTFGTFNRSCKRFASAATGSYQHILTDKKGEKQNVGLITLHRPKALNAICVSLLKELADAVSSMNKDDSIAAIVLTGSEKAFAAGAAAGSYQHILTDKKGEKQNVGLITLHRPKALNAICEDLLTELEDALNTMDKDETISAIVLTGSEKAFAAGADIKEMVDRTYSRNIREGVLNGFSRINLCKKPLIAAVNGFAFGGGCELAMLCDIIYAGDKARFGQLEIILGIIPGAGGTQRIARSCGKSKAMEMCLTGDQISAQEAEKMGLVSKVFPADQLLDESIKLAERIGRHSPLIVRLCKESVNVAFETTVQEGLRFEKNIFFATFATEDRKEGMTAFTEKRKPDYKNN